MTDSVCGAVGRRLMQEKPVSRGGILPRADIMGSEAMAVHVKA